MELGKRSKVSGFFNVPTWQPYLSMFPLPNRVSYLLVFVYSPENFLISNFIKPADLFHSSPYPHLKDLPVAQPTVS